MRPYRPTHENRLTRIHEQPEHAVLGHARSLTDRLPFVVTSRFACKPVVTACTEKIEFKCPVKQGGPNQYSTSAADSYKMSRPMSKPLVRAFSTILTTLIAVPS